MQNLIQIVRNKLDLIEFEATEDESILVEMGLLLESSPLIDQFGKDEMGVKLAKYLHSKYHVSDQAVLVPFTHPTGNLDLMTFKTHYDNFMFLKGPDGWAAVKPTEEYLRPRLGKPSYKPSTDKDLRYIGIFSIKGENPKDPPIEKELIASRGGSYKKPEKAESNNPSLADLLKVYIDKERGAKSRSIQVFRLMERDPEEVEKMPPARLMGRRSASIPTTASVQRKKVDVRAAEKPKDTAETMQNQIASKIVKYGVDSILRQVEVRRMRAGDEDNRIINQWVNNLESFKSILFRVVLMVFNDSKFIDNVKSEIDNYRTSYNSTNSDDYIVAKLAATRNPLVLSTLLKYVKNTLEDMSKV